MENAMTDKPKEKKNPDIPKKKGIDVELHWPRYERNGPHIREAQLERLTNARL